MKQKLDCFILYSNLKDTKANINELKNSGMVGKISILTLDKISEKTIENCELFFVENLFSTETISIISKNITTSYIILYLKPTRLQIGYFAMERMCQIASFTDASMVYSDHYRIENGVQKQFPLIDYQKGSLRDDFDFGALQLYHSERLKNVVKNLAEYRFAAFYALRLSLSKDENSIQHINEFLYKDVELDLRKSGEKQFDYVDPKNRTVQMEMETVCTEHLREIGAFLNPNFKTVNFDCSEFENIASVIIPVKNRIKTIADAINSVLLQKTDFPFNLIIVDNHSTDGTTELIQSFLHDSRVVHIIPTREDLGIGGCWNCGVQSDKCGAFAIQLDSDDVYVDETTIQKVVDTFRNENCAMVVGTYRMTNFDLQTIPPGIIDHREWSADNGANNALRINGLGAPRAFYTPILREIMLPNTSYGEDYAVGLRISREYKIGRIYDVIYLCRRWDDNSDAALDVEKMNRNNLYKDRIRSWELQARILKNRAKNESK